VMHRLWWSVHCSRCINQNQLPSIERIKLNDVQRLSESRERVSVGL
jgi:hypothetical protein